MADKGIANIMANVFYSESKTAWKGQLNYTPAAALAETSGDGWIFGQRSVTTDVNQDYIISYHNYMQNGSSPGHTSGWATIDADGTGVTGFATFGNDVNPVIWTQSVGVTASIVNHLSVDANGERIVAGRHYTVSYIRSIGSGDSRISIGTGSAAGGGTGAMTTVEVAAEDISSGSGTITREFTATASADYLWITVDHTNTDSDTSFATFVLTQTENTMIGNGLDIRVEPADEVLWMAIKVAQGDGTHGILLDFRNDANVSITEEKCIVIGPGELWVGKPNRPVVTQVHAESVIIDSNGDVTGDGTQTVETHFGIILKNVA